MDRMTGLRTFRRVVELNGFSAAARDLGYSNAAVSKIIKELEADLGVQLLIRTTRSLSLTDTGQAYFDRITFLLDELAYADEAAREHSTTLKGRLKLSAPMSLGLTVLSDLVAEFTLTYPDLRIDLEMSDGKVDIVAGGFDLAIRGGTLDDSTLRARRLMKLERIVCAAPSYLEQADTIGKPCDLKPHDCLVYTMSSSPHLWRLQRENKSEDVPVSGRFSANSSMAIRDAALRGVGPALLPTIYVEQDLKAGRLVNVLPGWSGAPQALFAVYPAHRESSRKLRVFIDYLVDQLRQT